MLAHRDLAKAALLAQRLHLQKRDQRSDLFLHRSEPDQAVELGLQLLERARRRLGRESIATARREQLGKPLDLADRFALQLLGHFRDPPAHGLDGSLGHYRASASSAATSSGAVYISSGHSSRGRSRYSSIPFWSGIAQVDRLAHAVVGGAGQREARVDDALHRRRKRLP